MSNALGQCWTSLYCLSEVSLNLVRIKILFIDINLSGVHRVARVECKEGNMFLSANMNFKLKEESYKQTINKLPVSTFGVGGSLLLG